MIPWVWLVCTGCLFEEKMVWSHMWIGGFGLSLPQGSILQSRDDQAQSRMHFLGLMPVPQGHKATC